MWRRIISGIFSIAIVVIGVIAFNRLNYWERSVRIFGMSNAEMRFEGRGRGRGGPRDFDRTDRRNSLPDSIIARFEAREGIPDSIRVRFDARERDRRSREEVPDSIRARFEAGERGRRFRDGSYSDSLPSRFDQVNGERMDRERFEAGFRDRGDRGRGDFRRGRNVRLNSVLRFLAVFAAFTVLALYSDKALRRFRKRRKKN